tara:strand:+ start:262 stop:972 length:711 start_codon:yes stop_codon:yes gene_type:complete
MEQDRIANLDVLILCGGFGTRLKEVDKGRPKPMVEIHGCPFLDILIQYVSSFGLRRFILCTGFKSEVIEQHFYKKNDGNTYIVSKEQEALGTGGGIKNAEASILSFPFMVLNGDSICRINLKNFVEFHKSNNASASMALAAIGDVRGYGSVIVDDRREIKRFNEKSNQIMGPGLVNAGIYLFEKKIMKKLAAKQKISLEYEVLPLLVGQKLFGFATEERLFDIGTPARLELLRRHF